MEAEVLVIGGGLSGLSLASALAAEGRDVLLVDARDRLGGRILSQHCGASRFDLGPAWFWPGQPRIASLIQRFSLTWFEQYSDGDLSFEDGHGQVQRGRGFASMQGSYRLVGGFGAMIDKLAKTLRSDQVRLDTRITSLTLTGQGIEARAENNDAITARRCVLALPPRIAVDLSFRPALPEAATSAMRDIATWMAGQAKAVAIYDRPFWRDAGLSGDATSRSGPMVEIHDASPQPPDMGALFGFIGVQPNARKDQDALKAAILAQFERLFGPEAAHPTELLFKDWAFDPLTSTPLDMQPLFAHPRYSLPPALSDLWDHRLHFAGTEVAPQFGGYLEGALEAAENVHAALFEQKV